MEPGLAEFLSFLKSIFFLLSLAAVPALGAVVGGAGLKIMFLFAPSGLPISADDTDFCVFIAAAGGFLVGLCLLPFVYKRLYK